MSDPRAFIVVGLGFGDCGKGTVTDHLVREGGAALVVRFNGGGQAGHNVVLPDGRHHTFSQLGAGTFAGARTHLADTVVVHPSALLVEARVLAAKGVDDPLGRLTLSRRCRVTTPFHQSAGRLRELARGANAHGTCGVGVGETVRDSLDHPDDVLVTADLAFPTNPLLGKLERIRQRLLGAAPDLDHAERDLLEDSEVAARWLEQIGAFRERARLVDDAEVASGITSDVVFEGAQGILLDEHVGFHPHTTWSTCTSAWAERWLDDHSLPHAPVRVGVTRTTLTRHGAGPLPSADRALTNALAEPHNGAEGWQGAFRVGWLDLPLLRYAIAANGGLDALALTHLDRLGALDDWQVVRAYPEALEVQADLEAQGALTRRLSEAQPTLEPLAPEALAAFDDWLERETEVPVRLVSHGPTYADKRLRGAW